jgi:mannose-6-phosphate isomerase-like protein (cupin superfamily)
MSKPAFRAVDDVSSEVRHGEHGGQGPLAFRRVLDRKDFNAPVDFVDYTVVPPGTHIGTHRHLGNDELYFVVAGTPWITVNGEGRRGFPGLVSIVHDGGSHSLLNDSTTDVTILVMQVSIT